MFKEKGFKPPPEIIPEIKKEEKEKEFSPSEALVKEKNALEKLWEKAKDIGKILFWVSCFAAGPGYAYASGYSREVPHVVAAEKMEKKEEDLKINKGLLEATALFMRQARENLLRKYPENAEVIDSFGREVGNLLEDLREVVPQGTELIFKRDSTLFLDFSKLKEKPQIQGKEITLKRYPVDKETVGKIREEIERILNIWRKKKEEGLEGERLVKAMIQSITEYWRGMVKERRLEKESVEAEEVWLWKNPERVKNKFENFKKLLDEKNIKEYDKYPYYKYIALDLFWEQINGREFTRRICKEIIKLCEVPEPAGLEKMIKERETEFDKNLHFLIQGLEKEGKAFAPLEHYLARNLDKLIARPPKNKDMTPPLISAFKRMQFLEAVYWAEKLGLNKDAYMQFKVTSHVFATWKKVDYKELIKCYKGWQK